MVVLFRHCMVVILCIYYIHANCPVFFLGVSLKSGLKRGGVYLQTPPQRWASQVVSGKSPGGSGHSLGVGFSNTHGI